MGEYSDILLGGGQTPQATEQPTGTKYSDILLGSPKPLQQSVFHAPQETRPEGTPGAGWVEQMKASFADNPEAQAKIFAAAMFPNEPQDKALSRFQMNKGEMVFRADDNKFYRVEPEGMWNWLSGVSAKLPSWALVGAPSVAGELAGSAVGMPTLGAGAGAAVGETARQAIGKVAFDDPMSWGDVGTEALMGATGAKLGQYVGKAKDAFLGRRAGKLGRAMSPDITEYDPQTTQKVVDFASRYGVDLNAAQATGSRSLVDKYKYLRDMPASADKILPAERRQAEQVQQAAAAFLDSFSGESSPLLAGKRLAETSQAARGALTDARAAVAKPLYDKAKSAGVPVDTTEVLDEIGSLLKTAPRGSKSARALNRVRTMLTKPDGGDLVDDISTLDNVKKEIDAMLRGPEGPSIARDTQRRLVMVKNKLVSLMDEASPDYRAARAAYSQASPPVEAFDNSVVGTIAKREADRPIERAALDLFDQVRDLKSIAYAKRIIEQQDPEAWQAALRIKLQDAVDWASKPLQSGDTGNLGGKFYQRLWGDVGTRKKLLAAMSSEQREAFTNFSEMMRRVGTTFGKESATAGRQELAEQFQREATGLGRRGAVALTSPLISSRNIISRALIELKTERYKRQLAEAILDPANIELLRYVRRAPAGSQKYLEAAGAFFASVGGGEWLHDSSGNWQPNSSTKTLTPQAGQVQP
jgi:hypothetical protein